MSSNPRDAATKRRPELEELLGGYSIGAAINALRGWHIAVHVLREIANGYMDGLPEEITAEIKAVLDISKGGDGVIYR